MHCCIKKGKGGFREIGYSRQTVNGYIFYNGYQQKPVVSKKVVYCNIKIVWAREAAQ